MEVCSCSWGGVSPVSPDHVNPEARWPHLEELAARTAETGKVLVERLAVYPSYALDAKTWEGSQLLMALFHASDSEGYARTSSWSPGAQVVLPGDELVLATQTQSRANEHVSADV